MKKSPIQDNRRRVSSSDNLVINQLCVKSPQARAGNAGKPDIHQHNKETYHDTDFCNFRYRNTGARRINSLTDLQRRNRRTAAGPSCSTVYIKDLKNCTAFGQPRHGTEQSHTSTRKESSTT